MNEGIFWPTVQPVHSRGDQPWDFFGRNDAKAETPVLWPPHVKSWLIGKDSDAGRDWGQEKKGTTEDEMAGWHHWLDGCESGWTPGVGDGQGGLACCNSWGRKELDTTEWLNWTDWLTEGGCTASHTHETQLSFGPFLLPHLPLLSDSLTILWIHWSSWWIYIMYTVYRYNCIPVIHVWKWKWSRSVVSDSLWPVDCSPPSSSVHGILQARILEWVAISFSRGSSRHRD